MKQRRKALSASVDEDGAAGGFGTLSPRVREILALLLIGGCLYVLLALSTFERATLDGQPIPRGGLRNLGGAVGYHLADGLLFLLGYAAWIPLVAGVLHGMALFIGRRIEAMSLKVLGAVVLAAMIALLLAGADGQAAPSRLAPYGPGGSFGANLAPKLDRAFGGSGRVLLLAFGGLCALLLATQWLVSELLLKLVGGLRQGVRAPAVALAGVAARGDADTDEELGEEVVADDGAAVEPERAGGLKIWRRRRNQAAAEDAESDAESGWESAEDADIPSPVPDEADEVVVEVGAAEAVGPEDSDEPEPAMELGLELPTEAEESESEPVVDIAVAGDSDGELDEDVDLEGIAMASPSEVAPQGAGEPDAADSVPDEPAEVVVPRRPVSKPRRKKSRRKQRTKASGGSQSELPFGQDYATPPIELFREVENEQDDSVDELLEGNKTAIEQRLGSFKLQATVVDASVGPAVTQYEVRLGEGIKLSKVHAYEADLAAALRAVSVRVVAPIPGKDTVGIEVPNLHRDMVSFRELLEEHAGEQDDAAIPLFLGKDVAGAPIVEDLAKMPHLLIAGTTGSGKSVCINTILMSILMTRSPQQCRLILIDPKMVELQVYKRLPHLACDVVTNMKRAPQVLEWTVEEMERRYGMLSAAGTNHIRSYNRLGKDTIEERLGRPIAPEDAHLPYMVIVIDELADLMNTAQKDVEESIQRLAQKSRAVGLHVILATQRPSTDVITGVIKANLPCQIAFKVNRKIDSRVILDSNGAEKLLGHGDMLYVSPTMHRMVRAQGAFVSEDEAHSVCKWLEDNGPPPDYLPDLVQTETGSKRRPADRDDLYEQACEVILGQQRGSATLIQRALAVGYNRATRLLEMMEDDGLVGPFVGSKSRDVLMTLEEWKEREALIADELEGADESFEEGDFEDGEFDGDEFDEDQFDGGDEAAGDDAADAELGFEDAGDPGSAETFEDDDLTSGDPESIDDAEFDEALESR